ncbi:MAG: galactokinase, partial [Planctomycetota bacterium]
ERREQCEAAARTLSIDLLRDADAKQLEAAKSDLDAIAYRRARHVIGENQRTLDCADAFAARDYEKVGELMQASHASLRDDFEVSTPELDALVEIASGLPSVIGSRMTGGGFGGCTVSLVKRDAADGLAAEISQQYVARTGVQPDAFVTVPSAGARILELPDP